MEVPAKQVFISSLNSKDLAESLDEGFIRSAYANGSGASQKVYVMEEDWVTGAIAGSYGWIATVSGGASTMNTAQLDATHWGLAQISSGTTSANNALLSLANPRVVFGTATVYWEANIRLTALSVEASNTYSLRIGFFDNFAGAPNNGIYFEYDTASSVNWRYGTANGGSRTVTSSSTAVAAATFIKLGMKVTGSSVEFFVDGTSIATQSTNFPTGSLYPAFGIIKGATGATAGILVIDWCNIYANWSTAR